MYTLLLLLKGCVAKTSLVVALLQAAGDAVHVGLQVGLRGSSARDVLLGQVFTVEEQRR